MIKDFKSFVFVSVDVKGVADANFVSVDDKGLTPKERSLGSRCSLRTTILGWMVVFVSVDVRALSREGSFGSRCSLRTTILGRMVDFVSVDVKGLTQKSWRSIVESREREANGPDRSRGSHKALVTGEWREG